MKTIIVSTLVQDKITLANGEFAGDYPGGAGLYAFCGAALFEEESLLLCGVGKDYKKLFGEWFQKNKFSEEGLLVKDEHTAISEVRYLQDGERNETPVLGSQHYKSLEATPSDLENICADANAVYIFKDFGEDGFWEDILRLREKHKFSLLWELNADITTKEHCEKVKQIAQHVDVLSLNQKEALQMLDCTCVNEGARKLQEFGVPAVYLRCGKKGALYITKDTIHESPSVQVEDVVDVTGAGNASSAAVLCGYARGYEPSVCAKMGSVAAAFCIAQYGPPLDFEKSRLQAQKIMKKG